MALPKRARLAQRYLRLAATLPRVTRQRLPAIRRIDAFVDAWIGSEPGHRIDLIKRHFADPRASRTYAAFLLAGGVVPGFRLVRPDGLRPGESAKFDRRWVERVQAIGPDGAMLWEDLLEPDGTPLMRRTDGGWRAARTAVMREVPREERATLESIAGQVIAIASLAGCLWPGMDLDYRDVPVPI